MDLIQRVTQKRAAEKKWRKKHDDFSTGDTVKVHARIVEGEKERVQIFRGVVIKIQGSGINKTFTVRKISSGVGVERTFPVISSKLDKVEIVSRGKVRRSRLYFLRNLKGRAARLQSELVISEGDPTSVDSVNAETETVVSVAGEAQATDEKVPVKKTKAEESSATQKSKN